jgi:hypothetical protein
LNSPGNINTANSLAFQYIVLFCEKATADNYNSVVEFTNLVCI